MYSCIHFTLSLIETGLERNSSLVSCLYPVCFLYSDVGRQIFFCYREGKREREREVSFFSFLLDSINNNIFVNTTIYKA